MHHVTYQQSRVVRIAGPAILFAFAIALSGCVDADEGNEGEDAVRSAVTRPPLSSICSAACATQNGQPFCEAAASTGGVSVRVFPRLEGKTVTPATELHNPGSWSSTSCPSCQWRLVSVDDLPAHPPFPPSTSLRTNSVQLSRNAIDSDWTGRVNLQIFDPTDSSVGVCDLHVLVHLINGMVN